MDINLDTLLIVTLYKAIESDNPNDIKEGMLREDFEDLVEDYIILQKSDPNIIELRIEKLKIKYKLALSCIYVLSTLMMDEQMMGVLNSIGFAITKDNYPFDLLQINKDLGKLAKKIKMMEDDVPDKLKKDKSKKRVSIYDILASMSSNLEGVYLDPRKVVVTEFISYQNVLLSKKEAYEKLKK